MDFYYLKVLYVGSELAIGAFGFMMFYQFLHFLPRKPRRWRKLQFSTKSKRGPLIHFIARILFAVMTEDAYKERKQLLLRSGIRIDPFQYEVGKKMLLFLILGGFVLQFIFFNKLNEWGLYPILTLTFSAAFLIIILFEKVMLEALEKQRTHHIVHEIYSLSHQLLYYEGSKMNLHEKLSQCLPHTHTIRQEWQLMLNDWYQDAGKAIQHFKNRTGTEEAFSFAETINAIRQS